MWIEEFWQRATEITPESLEGGEVDTKMPPAAAADLAKGRRGSFRPIHEATRSAARGPPR